MSVHSIKYNTKRTAVPVGILLSDGAIPIRVRETEIVFCLYRLS